MAALYLTQAQLRNYSKYRELLGSPVFGDPYLMALMSKWSLHTGNN